MAVRTIDFKRLAVAERYWANAVSDDLTLTRAVHEAGGRIRFEPRCLVASREESKFGEFLSWANRRSSSHESIGQAFGGKDSLLIPSIAAPCLRG
jgi:hypothetical protein